MKALVTGATGLVGRRLVCKLQGATVLSRNPTRARANLKNVTVFPWHPHAEIPPTKAFSGIDVVFHLAGEPVTKSRWTAKKKCAIRNSRVEGTKHLVDSLKSLKKRPMVLVVSSAIGYYGDRGDEELSENSSPASDFLAQVCVDWEAEAMKAQELGLRVVTARTGIVLAPDGGALVRMLPLFRLGLGGPLGSGRQWMSWIHIEDVIGLLLHAAQTEAIVGPINVVAPNAVTNQIFTKTIGQILQRPTVLMVPRFFLQAIFGEMSQILMASQRTMPKVAQDTGYRFCYQELALALDACLNKNLKI